MAKQMYLEFPIKTEHADDFFDLCNSSIGLRTKKQQGLFSEWMISTSENGKKIFHLWERWNSKKDFDAYMQTPERLVGSKFEPYLRKCIHGDTKVFGVT